MSGDADHAAQAAVEASREQDLSAAAKMHALELVTIAAELRWGDGTAAGCLYRFLAEAASDVGIAFFRYGPLSDLPVATRAIFDRDGWRCQHCGDDRNLTVDHIVPRSKRGSDDPTNLQTLCGRCNSRKGAR